MLRLQDKKNTQAQLLASDDNQSFLNAHDDKIIQDLDLPREMLLEISSYLKPQAKTALALSCQDMHSVFKHELAISRLFRCHVTNIALTDPVIVHGKICERSTILSMIEEGKLDITPESLVTDQYTQHLMRYTSASRNAVISLGSLDDLYKCPIKHVYPDESASYCILDGQLYTDSQIRPWLRIFQHSPADTSLAVGPHDLIRHPLYETINKAIGWARLQGKNEIDLNTVFRPQFRQMQLERVKPYAIDEQENPTSFRWAQVAAALTGAITSIQLYGNIAHNNGHRVLKLAAAVGNTYLMKKILEKPMARFITAATLKPLLRLLPGLFIALTAIQMFTADLSVMLQMSGASSFATALGSLLPRGHFTYFLANILSGISFQLDCLYLTSQYYLFASKGLWQYNLQKVRRLFSSDGNSGMNRYFKPITFLLMTAISAFLILDAVSKHVWSTWYLSVQFIPMIVRFHFFNVAISDATTRPILDIVASAQNMTLNNAYYLIAICCVAQIFFPPMAEFAPLSGTYMLISLLSLHMTNEILADYELGRFPVPELKQIPLDEKDYYYRLRTGLTKIAGNQLDLTTQPVQQQVASNSSAAPHQRFVLDGLRRRRATDDGVATSADINHALAQQADADAMINHMAEPSFN